jgi:23S rRNA (adenine2503-C2)-methyltransferase
MNLPNIRHLSESDLRDYVAKAGEKSFRARQITEWLWLKQAHDFEAMTNLGQAFRRQLKQDFSLPALRTDTIQQSADGTIKSRFRTHDNHLIEGVLIPAEDRKTACVSSQIGCSLTCKFCATGYMERKRNLHFDEIYDQVVFINRSSEENFGKKLTNIVFMGMGEPLLNYSEVMKAIARITDPEGMGMSPRRITVSTAGVAKQIKKLGDDQVRFKLALSLHAANDSKRNQIMPINETNNIKALSEALRYFYEKTGNEITLEYILLQGVNDSESDAMELVKIFRQVPADLVNLIEYNPIEAFRFQRPEESAIQQFMRLLEKNGVNARLRRSRGKDIDAACGQLANKD